MQWSSEGITIVRGLTDEEGEPEREERGCAGGEGEEGAAGRVDGGEGGGVRGGEGGPWGGEGGPCFGSSLWMFTTTTRPTPVLFSITTLVLSPGTEVRFTMS